MNSRNLQSRSSKTGLAVFLAGASALALTAVTPALAQQVETVTVTAERHVENEQDVPISTSVLDSDQTAAIYESGEDIKAIANHVPGLYAESSNGRVAPRFYIRGLGNSDFDLAASQPVSIIMDDVVMENTILKSSPVFDIDNVEVDRGPQGTLFGRNTTAGIVKFTSKKPTEDFEGYGMASFGELGTANMEGAFGGPLTDTLSFRVSGLWQHREDWINNGYRGVENALGGYNDRAVRAQLLWQPSSNFSALLNLHGRSLEGTAAIFRANIFTKGVHGLNANYIPDTVFFDGGYYNQNDENPQKYDGLGAGLTMNYNFSNMVLTSITGYETTHGYSRGDIDGGNTGGPGLIFFPSDTQDGLDYLRQFTQEIHLASDYKDSPIFWQVGAFYFDTKYQDTTNPFFIDPTHVRQSNDSFALFGQTSYKLTSDFTLTGGVRWTTDVKAMTADGPLDTITVPVKTNGNNVSWDVSGDYKLNDDVNLYARIATGFRAPSIQGRNIAFNTPLPPPQQPGNYSVAQSETITSYEVGAKTSLFDNSLRLNVDGFDYFVHNMQLTAVGGAAVGNSVILLNAHGGLAYGLEADAEWAATEHLSFTFGATWTHTEIRDPNLAVGVCAQCTVTSPTVGGNALVNGNPFPQAPDFLLSWTAKYTWPMSDGSAFTASTDWWWQGYTNFFLYKSVEFNTNGNYAGGLRLSYLFPDKRNELAIYGRNITDARNVQGGIDFDDLTGFVGDPRVMGVEYRLHFGE
ncbi:MAG TPA: TonB-dependent receptor [Rhizomicrobium sp.]|nr:TonB-dependent receptor [Rhizomicrobium sp.]